MAECLQVFAFISILGIVGAFCPNIISRAEWGAKQGRVSNAMIMHPASHVIIHHSRTPKCERRQDCVAMVESLQKVHMKYKGRDDIGYNFLIGEDGNIYEGTGWNKAVTNVASHDRKSIHIAVMGDYTSWLPPDRVLNAMKELIDCGVLNGSIHTDYRLVGHRQLESVDCPGMQMYQVLRRWPNWSPY